MLRTLFCAALFFLQVFDACSATEDNTDVARLLKEVVNSDFEGDASPRIGHVFQRRQASVARSDSPGPAFETYDLDGDSLVVVTDVEFIVLKSTKSKTCAQYRFKVVAKTVGTGLPSWVTANSRHIIAMEPATNEIVTYCGKFDGRKWMLVDPPIPRVSLKRLVSFLNERSARAEKIASETASVDPRALLNVRRVSDSLKEQLTVLLSL